jgi:hypothetical protein
MTGSFGPLTAPSRPIFTRREVVPMKFSPIKLAFYALLGAVVVQGCRCGPPATQRQYGELGLVYEVEGGTRTDREALYDFGSEFMGKSLTRTIVVKNLGAGQLTLTSLEKLEGDTVLIGETGDANPVWNVAFTPGTNLPVSGFVEINVTFTPTQVNEIQREHGVKLLLRAENARDGEGTATLTFTGVGLSGVCELPKTLDFGKVARDDSYRHSVELRNPTQLAASAFVGAITSSSGDHTAFSFAPESAQGDITIEPGGNRKVLIDFRPTENKSYLAFVKMRASEHCREEVNVTLTGTGVDSVLTWAPTSVDCGYVTPGIEVTRKVTFTNDGLAGAELSALKTQNNTEFRIVAAAGQDPGKLSIPGGGKTAELTVGCKPAVLGPRQTQLTFSTNLPKQPSGQLQVKVFGGGPDIQVQPSPNLNFGKVAYFAGVNPPSFAKRKLTVLNVGSAPAVPDNKANLRLGTPDASGNPQQPYFTVVPLNNDTAANEFQITLPASYDPVKGLVAKVGENAAELEVKFTPISLGMKQAKVTIFSNDPDEPAKEIVISANSVDVPPCNYTVSPTALNFGLISPPDYRDLGFSIKNNGTQAGEICLLSGLARGNGTHTFFSLPQGDIETYEMAPNEQLQVLVRVHPQGMTPSGVTNIEGTVDFFMSSPLKPQTTVKLDAQLAPSCLTIAPDELDFGTVQVGCSSVTRTFSVYNTCSTAVKIHSFGMQSAAGQPAGGANCAGTQPCPEFLLVQSPAIPAGGLTVSAGQAPLTFQAKYKPIDIGSDTGAIAVTATQSGSNVTYVVALKGKGDNQGIHTDVFTQDLKPKADVLIAIDNSCSMSSYQASLAANFDSFIKFAEAAKVDYHIAVITTDDSSATHQGRFVSGPSHPEKILTSTTVDVENKFKAKVAVGINGSAIETCLSPLLKAVTAPLVNNENAGFLRDEASLAMICVTDASDQSSQPATYYLNNFWNVKGHNRKTQFTFNAIAGFNPSPPSGCPYDSGPDDGSYAYLVSQTNGVKDEICTPDWSKTLEELGKTGLGFRTNFFLTSVPDLTKGPIIVAINGVPVPAVDDRGATVWTFDSVGNSVNFEPMYVPEPGQTLTITYHVTCYP